MYSLKKIIFLFATLAFFGKASAQAPDWSANPSDYQYTMTVTTFLSLDHQVLSDTRDKVGAFVNNEARGEANLIFVEGAERYLAYLTIYGNTPGEKVEFRIYDSKSGGIVSIDTTLDFSIDGQVGNVFQAFSLANPPLSNKAEITAFYFANADTISTAITREKVDIVVDPAVEVVQLIPEFLVSDGASMYIDRVPQESGSRAMDFSFPVSYTVLSEDQSVANTYEVLVTFQEGDAEKGFVCTNVITANNDGSNDYWVVEDASKYRDYSFEIFDVNGRILFESTGYNNNWDGHYKGRRLDRGKYYYKVVNKEKSSVITGNILVLY